MKFSEQGIDFIKSWEKLRLNAYKDAGGKMTIGYGHLLGSDETFLTITEERADQLLANDLRWVENTINKSVDIALNQNQFDALGSIIFNVGPGRVGLRDGIVTLRNGKPSHLLQFTNNSSFTAAADEFLKWDHTGGVQVDGLSDRRAAERDIYLTGTYNNHS